MTFYLKLLNLLSVNQAEAYVCPRMPDKYNFFHELGRSQRQRHVPETLLLSSGDPKRNASNISMSTIRMSLVPRTNEA